MVYFKNKNARGQREGLRSRTVIDRVFERARVAAERYRVARRAKLGLSGAGDWEDMLRVLEDGDIRGYQDVEKLPVRVGRPGTLEDEQVAAQEAAAATTQDVPVATANDDVAAVDLVGEARDKRDGTGETRRTLSWIWTTNSRLPDANDEGDDILRSEWAKSRARAERCREEVLLLKEEMRRAVAFLDWKTKWWLDRRLTRNNVSKELAEGLAAYAEGQAELQKELRDHFCMLWKMPLVDNVATSASGEESEEGDDDNEEDDNEEFDDENEGKDSREGTPLDENEDFEGM